MSRPARVLLVFAAAGVCTAAFLQPLHVAPRAKAAKVCRAPHMRNLQDRDASNVTELAELRTRVQRLEDLLERAMFALTNSDDLALVERQATSTYIVDEGLTKRRPARLMRTSLLAIMRSECMPLPPSAKSLENTKDVDAGTS